MSDEKKLPKRRFKQFLNTPSWEQRKLGEVVERVSCTSEDSEIPQVEYEDIISGEGRLNKDITKKLSNKKGILFRKGDVLYGKLRPYLKNWLLPDFSGKAVGDFWVLRSEKVQSSFLYNLIQSNRFELASNQSTGTKMPRADWNLVANTEFPIPVSIEEQISIGNIFKLLNNSITLHQRKLNKLENLKKAYLEELFPDGKQSKPKRRFKEFKDDWEQRKLGDVIASLYNGQTPSRFDKANWEGDIPWLTSGELNRGVVNHSIEKITQQGRDDANLKIVPKGTVVIAITGLEAAGTRGNCAKLGFNTTLNQSCMAIYPKSEFLDPDFLFQWYIAVGEEYGIKYTQGTEQQSYNAELIKILPISVPSVIEQRKIARILDSFDDIITLHQRKLQKLKKMKEAYLDELFV